MKQINIVRNTIENGSGLTRLKSRIVSASSRVWLAFAPILFVVFGLFGVNERAWATWPTYEGSCSTNGYVVYDESLTLYTIWSTEIDLAGPGATVSFEAKRDPTGQGEMKVAQLVNGEWSNPIWSARPGKVTKRVLGVEAKVDYESYTVSTTLDPQATKIKFYTTAGATLNKYVQKIRVTRASGNAYALYTGPLDCGSADYNVANSSSNYTTGTAYVDWSHIATAPTCSISGSQASYFEVKTKTNTPTTNTYGVMSVQVAYKHTAPGDHSATLNVGGKTITIKGHTNKITPYIDTTPTVDTITYGQTISNSQLGTGLVKADLINAAGTVVPGTWTIDENGQTVTTSGGSNTTVHLTFAPTDVNTYDTIHTTQTMFVRSVATISWVKAYSAEKPTVPVGKWIENAATTNAAGAVITYSSTSSKVEISADGHSFRFTEESEAEVVASHGVTATHGSASETKTFKSTFKDIQVIVWPDRFDRLTTEMTTKPLIAEVWIENPTTGERAYSAERTALLEYSVEDNTVVSIPENSTTLTIHKKGNTTLTASVEGNDQYESASVTMEVKVREPSAGCDDPLLLDIKNNGTNDYLYRFFQMNTNEIIGDEYAINVAQGQVPDKLSFGHKGEYYKPVSIIGSWTYFKGPIKAQQKVDGKWIDVPNSSVTPTVADWKEFGDLQLDEKATHIRFVRPQGGEGYHYVRNVEVTMKHFIQTETPEVDFGNTIKVNSSEFRDVTIHYSNVKDALSVTNPFESDVTTDDVIDVDSCGAFGYATLSITYSPTTAGPINDVIVVKDPILKTTCDIRVKADVQRADQTITWNPDTELLATETIELNGTTNGKEHGVMNAITYTVTNNDGVISVSDNEVTILKPGTVTITATQNGSTNYGTADPVEKNFTISAETLTILETPTASDITYGQTLSASTLTGGSVQDSKGNTVAGSFSWQAASTQPNAGDNQNFTVVFAPKENAAWYNTLTTSVAVNVEKADATLSWTSAPTELAYNATGVVYTATSASNGTITYSITSGDSYAHIDANTGALTIDVPGKSITVQATQAEGTNHNVPEAITVNVTIAAAPVNEFTNATGDGEWDTDDNWSTGTAPSTSEPDIIVAGQLVIDEVKTVGSMTIMPTGGVTIIEGGLLTVNKATPDQTGGYGDLRVAENGALALNDVLQVRDFTIDASLGNSSNAGTSGQVSGEVNLHVNRNAYFQMSFDPDNKISYGWYDFTVPFEVEVLNGIYDDHMNKLTNGVDYLVMNFSEARRASSGKGWGSFTGTMQPGRIYSIGFDETRVWNTFIFKKKSGSITLSDGSYDVEYSNAGAADDRGWNGLGNGTLQHRELTGMGSRKVQVYNHSADNYSAYDADEKAYAVGTAFFLQADEYLSSISLTTTDGLKALHAPKYSGRSLDEFRLTLTAEGADRYTDRMWVSASEEATGEYVIGRDLIKMGAPTDSKVAQMWAINNDLRLCDIEMPMMNDKAQCSLSFFAPNALTYEIAVDEAPEDATLYLTYNGRVIWSLTASPYTIDLTQGMTEGYGLRIEARHNAPQVATGMDEVDVDQNGNRKVLIDNMLYILTPEGAMYSVTGEKVK